VSTIVGQAPACLPETTATNCPLSSRKGGGSLPYERRGSDGKIGTRFDEPRIVSYGFLERNSGTLRRIKIGLRTKD
jgi:hypothetical protein